MALSRDLRMVATRNRVERMMGKRLISFHGYKIIVSALAGDI